MSAVGSDHDITTYLQFTRQLVQPHQGTISIIFEELTSQVKD